VPSVMIRAARPGDGPGLARIHADMAAYYAELAPERFRAASRVRLAQEIDIELATRSGDTLHLVAEVDARLAPALVALHRPTQRGALRDPGRRPVGPAARSASAARRDIARCPLSARRWPRWDPSDLRSRRSWFGRGASRSHRWAATAPL
jgi:hypothetical protein